MTRTDIDALDTIGTSDFDPGTLADEELEIPFEMIPPNPDESDTLPSQVHPSYPYGDPTRLNHPASFPRGATYDPYSRALFEDVSSLGVNATLRWRELALDLLLPVDAEKAEAERAAHARKLASGTGNPAPRAQQQQPPAPAMAPPAQYDEDEDDEDDEDEEEEEEENDENDENAVSYSRDIESDDDEEEQDPQALVRYMMDYDAEDAALRAAGQLT
ncbi:hypothetical protein EXIGLDRAFT_84450 [Exidia glandulosa HHB12029]|uniref:Uncharacterized protein n=1 Tax=Exidia glandulosa HHB12029 TaxID=1314781 RepID=A0A165HI77_EXIGL|nr:hypothetical protein EXIGLDRAFT_84450 [Exidia glandulosa HHB12029]